MPRTTEEARKYMKEWRERNPEKKRAIAKRWADSHKDQIRRAGKARYISFTPEERAQRVEATKRWRHANRLRRLLSSVKARAKRKRLPFDLVLADLVIPSECPVLGIPLFFSSKKGPNTPSVDRIDNLKGYTKGNVLIVSLRVV